MGLLGGDCSTGDGSFSTLDSFFEFVFKFVLFLLLLDLGWSQFLICLLFVELGLELVFSSDLRGHGF